jgi:hypothetical protein
MLFWMASLLLLACDNANEPETGDSVLDQLAGHWVSRAPVDVFDAYVRFKRAKSLPKDDSGFLFMKNGNCVKREADGWGTPSVVYSDYKGTWTAISDSVIHINWDEGITVEYNWKIVSLEDDMLTVYPFRLPRRTLFGRRSRFSTNTGR